MEIAILSYYIEQNVGRVSKIKIIFVNDNFRESTCSAQHRNCKIAVKRALIVNFTRERNMTGDARNEAINPSKTKSRENAGSKVA